LIEAANARHEREYVVWETVGLREGKILIPGVITHSTDVVEHPELVSQRVQRFAALLGKENVIAGADCGFGGARTRKSPGRSCAQSWKALDWPQSRYGKRPACVQIDRLNVRDAFSRRADRCPKQNGADRGHLALSRRNAG
jgi:hypothetical protein